jgi:phosphoglycolate phosphatase-like HAD superfamily hydrolase
MKPDGAAATVSATAAVLASFVPRHRFFVGVDSDGCAFDAMDIKHKECFTPNTIKHWGLQPVSTIARQTAEFVNLYSTSRGQNRWIALVRVLDLLRERPEVDARGVKVPDTAALQAFIDSGSALSHAGLLAYAEEHPDPVLDRALAWSAGVDATIEDLVKGCPPFAFVRESLELMRASADVMVVSATPMEALQREWSEHGIASCVDVIAGQELGTKARHLELAAKGKYADEQILLIGDAPGDRDAARSQGVLFYPINPGAEAASWERFHDEAFARFTSGTFAGDYQAALIDQFEALLPTTPPWKVEHHAPPR